MKNAFLKNIPSDPEKSELYTKALLEAILKGIKEFKNRRDNYYEIDFVTEKTKKTKSEY